MIALCVDDEAPLLSALLRAVEASPDVERAVGFRVCSEALAWAEENRPDIAFLDIRLRGCTGIEVAEKLRKKYPDLPVVFCTGYREYALEAIQMHATGYVLKPVTAEAIQKEISFIRNRAGSPKKLLTVRCFGNFEVFSNGMPLHFARRRAKEVLAYLVDRRGSAVTAREICAVMWEDVGSPEKNMQSFYKLLAELLASLSSVGAESIVIRANQDYAVNPALIDCDYYRFLDGDPSAKKAFTGEYMSQYSWGEMTAAGLQV